MMFDLRKWFRSKYLAPHPLALSSIEIATLMNEKKVCPDCGEWKFDEDDDLTSVICCANCGSRFNDDSTYSIERLFTRENVNWCKKDKYTFSSYKNYRSYTWTILSDWYKIDIPDDDRQDINNIMKFTEWCGTDMSPSSLWSIKDYTIYFKNNEDAMAFKLKWL